MANELSSKNTRFLNKESTEPKILKKIWLAGIGAFIATEESDKAFNLLVDKGRQFQEQWVGPPAEVLQRTTEEDWSSLVPNFIETAVRLWLDAIHKDGDKLIDGSLDSMQLLMDLVMAALTMPTNIQVLFVRLVQTAQKVVEVSEQRKPIVCPPEATRMPAKPGKVKELIRNHLELTERLLSLADDCPARLAGDNWHKYSDTLRKNVTEQFSEETIGALHELISEGKKVYEKYEHDPIFIKDLFNLIEVVKRYSRKTPEVPEYNFYDDPLFLIKAIVGEPEGWFKEPKFSEFKVFLVDDRELSDPNKFNTNGRHKSSWGRYLRDVWLGVSSTEVVSLKKWQEDAWDNQTKDNQTKDNQTKDNQTKDNQTKDSKKNSRIKIPQNPVKENNEEIWFYINGIATDHYVAQLNAERLADLFRRSIYILHNETEGLYRDLAECVRGRVQDLETRAMVDVMAGLLLHTRAAILDSRIDDDSLQKVVVIAHSQGTILIAGVVKAMRSPQQVKFILEKMLQRDRVDPPEIVDCVYAVRGMGDEELEARLDKLLKKLEIYNFANCADDFLQKEIPPGGGQFYPGVVEHFINQHDLVPAFTPQQSYGFTGAVFERVGAWGHLLNAHYLDTGKLDVYKPRDGRQASRLAHYLAEAK